MHPLIADQRYRPFAAIGLDGGLPPPSCRSYSAHKESPAEAGQGLSWKENQDEATATITKIAAVLRLEVEVRKYLACRATNSNIRRLLSADGTRLSLTLHFCGTTSGSVK